MRTTGSGGYRAPGRCRTTSPGAARAPRARPSRAPSGRAGGRRRRRGLLPRELDGGGQRERGARPRRRGRARAASAPPARPAPSAVKIQSSGPPCSIEVGGVVDRLLAREHLRRRHAEERGPAARRPGPSRPARRRTAARGAAPSARARPRARARPATRPARATAHAASAAPPSGASSRLVARDPHEVERGQRDVHRRAALPEDEGRRGQRAGSGHEHQVAQTRHGAGSPPRASPSSRCAPRKTLKKGTARPRARPATSQPRPSPACVRAVERDERAEQPAPAPGSPGSRPPARGARCRAGGPPTSGPAGWRRRRTRSPWPAGSNPARPTASGLPPARARQRRAGRGRAPARTA